MNKLVVEHVREWLASSETQKMRDMARHGMQRSQEALMPFVDLAHSYVEAMRENEQLWQILEKIHLHGYVTSYDYDMVRDALDHLKKSSDNAS